MNHPDAKGYYELSASSSHIRKRTKQFPEDVKSLSDKREQARQRQRRKRERDRATSAIVLYPGGTSDVGLNAQDPGFGGLVSVAASGNVSGKKVNLDNLPPEEAQKKQRVREAARERQRKHRAGIKAKRMAELGMAIVNQGGGIEQTAIGYTINENGQYEAVLADPSDPTLQHSHVPPPFPVPQAHATPGQMFASTLLLGLSCTPQLKQQLLRILRSTTEDLTAFEPFIAAAFDHWEHSRSLHYAAHGHHVPPSHLPPQTAPYCQPYPPLERFQRPLVAAFPTSPQHGREQSLSPSEDSHRATGDSDTQIEHEKPNVSSGLGHDPGQAGVTPDPADSDTRRVDIGERQSLETGEVS